MLKVEDLRVGNQVYDDYSGIVEVININSQYCYVDYKKPTFKAVGRCEIQYIQPIPITEEWLIKFGGIDNVYTIEIGQLQFTWASRIIATGERCSWSCEQYPHIQYVHQLQNLYFALTNEELICN